MFQITNQQTDEVYGTKYVMILDVLWGMLHSNSLFYTFCGEISEISIKHPFARLKCVTIQFLMCHSLDEKS